MVTLGLCLAEVDCAQSNLTKDLISAYDSVAPLRSIKLSSKRKSWVSPGIRALMKKRDATYKTATHSGLDPDAERFKALRAQVRNALDTAKNQYIASKLSQADDEEALWR